MSFSIFNSKYVDQKRIEKLFVMDQEENNMVSCELDSITSTLVIDQVSEKVRNTHWNIEHPIRRDLWMTLCQKISVDPWVDLYHGIEKKLFGKGDFEISSLPAFVDPASCILYYLNTEGQNSVHKIIHMIHSMNLNIEYSFLLYPLVSLFLHYMSEEMAFSCALKLLYDRKMCITRTEMDLSIRAFDVKLLAKKFAKNAYERLSSELKDHDFENLFLNWLSWIFNILPFPYLIRVIDWFLVEGVDILYRVFLALLVLFSENAGLGENEVQMGIVKRLQNYVHSISIPVDKLFKVAYNIDGSNGKVVNQQVPKTKFVEKKYLDNSEINDSVNMFNSNNPASTICDNSGDQDTERGFAMDALNRSSSDWALKFYFKSEIITPEQMSRILNWLPARISKMHPEIRYSSVHHGMTLFSFYMRVDSLAPTILIVKSTNDEVFGAYCPSAWRTRMKCNNHSERYDYFGNGESFLFTLVPQLVKYPWIGISARGKLPLSSQLFMAADDIMISVGAGNGQGLVLHDNLLYGRTEHCDTFDNEPLCSMQDFQCKIVEVVTLVAKS